MSDIQTYLRQILDAVYGEEVRNSIHDAISTMNSDLESAIQDDLNPLAFKGNLGESGGTNNNLNNLIQTDQRGIWRLLGGTTYTNVPSDFVNSKQAYLIMYAFGTSGSTATVIKQEIHYFSDSGANANMSWSRVYLSGEWQPWHKNVDNSLSIEGAAADAKATGNLKSSLSNLSKLNYAAQINTLDTVVPFHANIGDSVTIKTADGSEFTADSKIRFLDKDMNNFPSGGGLWWLGTGRSSRTISADKEYYFVYTFDGNDQDIIVENSNSEYDFRVEDSKLKERLVKDENGFLQSSGSEQFIEVDLSAVEFEFGGLDNSTGEEYASRNVIRSKPINTTFADRYSVLFQASGNFGLWKVHKFSTDDNYLGADGYGSSGPKEGIFANRNVAYIRLSIEYWSQAFQDLTAADWFKAFQLLYPISGSAVFANSICGASFIELFKNTVHARVESAYTIYQAGQNYIDKEIAQLNLLPNTKYTLICGDISDTTYQPRLRVYISYKDGSVDRLDANKNNPFNTFTTRNTEINYANIYAIPVFGVTTESSGICYFTNVALIEGYPILRYGSNDSVPEIPTYYESSIALKETAIRANEKDCAFSGDSFVFLTDTHFADTFLITGDESSNTYNANHSIGLIKHILDNTSVRLLCFGGDLVNSSDSIDGMLKSISRFESSFSKDKSRIMYCVGNHEYYTDLGQSVPNRPTAEWLYGAGMKYNEYAVVDKHISGTYCFDNTAQKIRYFVIPCGRDTETTVAQAEWVLNKLLDIPSGYHIICIGHAFLLDNMSTFRGYYANIIEGLEAIKSKTQYTWNGNTYDYSSLDNVTVVCTITGHTHIDGNILSSGGVLCICTTCDSWEQNYELQSGSPVKVSRELNTVNEQAFDVFQFDFTRKKIYCTRIGYGSDREFSYT